MSVYIAYELRVHVRDSWRIEAIFDERALAVDAAKRLQLRNPRQLITVVEESFDEEENLVKEEIVFRSQFFENATKIQVKQTRKTTSSKSEDKTPKSSVAINTPLSPLAKKLLMLMGLVAALAAYVGLQYFK
mgnify:CR=1 FL=1